jgi:hypothetical protein
MAAYFESQFRGETVVHVDHLISERVGVNLHEVWDVHTSSGGRWWVVTTPTNLYSQEDFKSADVVLSFHVGLIARVMTRQEVPVASHSAALLPESWRRWQHAVDTMLSAAEAEDFQAVGMQLRECLIGFAQEVASDELVPAGEQRPQAANASRWTELLAEFLASGSSSAKLRSYLKKLGNETWAYVNWLTHARGARFIDAEIGATAVSHLLGVFTAARMRWEQSAGHSRCPVCDSYAAGAGRCPKCGWVDEEHVAPARRQISDEERAGVLAEPCTPSSDISTFMTPETFAADVWPLP